MNKPVLFVLFIVLLCLAGCVTQSRLEEDHLDALGHPVRYPLRSSLDWSVHDMYESDLRRLLSKRAQKDEIFNTLSHEEIDRVSNEAYWNKFFLVSDGQPTGYSRADREEWKRKYRLSWETYVFYAEDGNIMIRYFDGLDHLWQYEHL